MTFALTMLVWSLVLALVQIFAFAIARTRQYGSKWNAGPRDEVMPPLEPIPARLQRAQANLFETLPLFAAAVLVAYISGRDGRLADLGAGLYLAGRVAYVPLYVMGVAYIRSLAWLVSLAGLGMILVAILRPA